MGLIAAVAVACGRAPDRPRAPVVGPSPLVGKAVLGVGDPALRAILADQLELRLAWAPMLATTLGDHRFDDQLGHAGPDAIAAQERAQDALFARVTAIDPATLDARDRVTWGLLRDEMAGARAERTCRYEQWNVDAANASLFGGFSYIVEAHVVHGVRDADNLLARMRQVPGAIEDAIANYRLGVAAGRFATREKLRRAIEQLDTELARPVEAWSMANPAWAAPPAAGDDWPAGERARHVQALRAIVATQIKPAVQKLRAFFHDELLPHGRGEQEGLASLPGGDACYRASILAQISLAKTPEELHALGLAEIARTDREIAALGKTALGTSDLATTITRLRDDKRLYFTSRDELLAAAQKQLDLAKAAIPRFFAVLPRTDCVLRETPAYEAPYSTLGYYREPHLDGSKPGEYFVNTYKPQTRARYELAALSAHESIPGHHLQIALSQEMGDQPLFRRMSGSTAFIEGWALYTERLADEMGLYTNDLDRLGRLSYDAWRGARLVVDTGLHAMGWTRKQAEDFMRAHTALTETNIVNEVDRYIGWPGQALAYKMGQLEILKLRGEAEAKLGARFDLRQFHAAVLGAGAVTLPVLDERVRAWIAAQ
ncbi:MAG TPA: DUF885 domain-containing protein [Kofleriaceae bacterium]|nr:DUF885 domain-containing protein [Kofleriaceae bacterium]